MFWLPFIPTDFSPMSEVKIRRQTNFAYLRNGVQRILKLQHFKKVGRDTFFLYFSELPAGRVFSLVTVSISMSVHSSRPAKDSRWKTWSKIRISTRPGLKIKLELWISRTYSRSEWKRETVILLQLDPSRRLGILKTRLSINNDWICS